MSLPSSVDIAIIGAGAAGLGAAHALKNSGLSFVVLESARPGRRTRAHHHGLARGSPSTSAAAGCIPRTRTPLSASPSKLNFEIDKTLPPWRDRAVGKAFPQKGTRRVHPRARCFL